MSEMIERVARSLWHDRFPDEHWLGLDEPTQEDYRGHARAAIEAMRFSTDEMDDAGLETGAFENGVFNVLPSAAGRVWTAMIDAALSEDGAS